MRDLRPVAAAGAAIGMITPGRLANAARYDADRICRAIGPCLEVGVNPLWRSLLESARELVAATDNASSVAL